MSKLNFLNIFIILVAIIAFIFITIFLIRLFLNLTIYLSAKKQKITKQIVDYKNKKSPKFLKEEEELRKFKEEIPKAHSKIRSDLAKQQAKQKANFEIINEKNNQENYEEKTVVVGIAKPVGYWTGMVLGKRLSLILSMAQSTENNGNFWQNLVAASRADTGSRTNYKR